jgi:N-acetylglucosamine-6-phosphate deacetylase
VQSSATLEVDVNRTKPVAIDAGAIFSPIQKYAPGRLIIEGGAVREIGLLDTVAIPAGAERIDASRLIVTPGFIDPHIHGTGGTDVMNGTYESLNAVSRIVVRHGTTAFLPTTVSSPAETLGNAVEKLGLSLSKTFGGATPMGIHLEGPFISAAKRGTHKASDIIPPNLELLERLIRSSNYSIRLLTVAPELEGIDKVLLMAAHFGVTLAMGHSNATLEEARAAADRGICYAVHTFNAMRAFGHRDPGITGAVLADDRIFAEIIADGIHVDPAVIRIFARSKDKKHVLLVTDAISATDMPDGRYRLGEDNVNVIDGVCRDFEGRLAGSTLTQEVALRNFAEWSGWAFEDALLSLTLNPARALKLEKKGSLEPGYDADIVILDGDYHVVMTFVGGRKVFG